MAYLAAMNRFQTRITSLDKAIYKDNPVRFIDTHEDWQNQVDSTKNSR